MQRSPSWASSVDNDPEVTYKIAFADHQRSMRARTDKIAERNKQQRRAARKKQKAENLKQSFFEDEERKRLERVFSMKHRSCSITPSSSAPSSARTTSRSEFGWTQSQSRRPCTTQEHGKARSRDTSHRQGRTRTKDHSLNDKTSEFIRRVYAPEWQIRQAAQMQSQKLERQTMLKRELGNIPAHQLEIMDNSPNYPWNNYPYRPDPVTGYSKWPIQGMQGSKTPIRTAPFAISEWGGWKTMKDDMYDPKRDGPCPPRESTKDICSPYA
jgi:hypothetical protein